MNGDGKSTTFSTAFLAGPNTKILDCHMDQTTYSKKKDGTGLVTLSDMQFAILQCSLRVRIRLRRLLLLKRLGSNAGDLTGTFSQAIDFGSLPKPDAGGTEFQVIVKDQNGNAIGGSVFTLFP